ncbi:MAG: 4-hydroxy-tetrahydrodipicolinate reductase [Erythrobacter sp.]|jgi:4-hydroxy-tetrahydrodipicolinate reductase|nr:4-hydroxy-tetrahydrodipicolinate reductase [Erythrobacter sp.]
MTDRRTRFAVLGHKGRMGRALGAAIEEAGHEFCVGVDLGGDPAPLLGQCDVAVDFSAPDALAANLSAASEAGIPLLIGTTGLAPEHFAAIDEAAQAIPVLQTGNTSLGVTLLAALVREAAERLGAQWDIEIVEMHHRGKVDAPSGTAKLLGEAAAQGRGIVLRDNREAGRDGNTGERAAGAIGFASLRGGTVTGEHSVIFAGDQERLVLSHSAEDRMIFARGAVRGAAWLIGRTPGRYTMEDVLGLKA